MGRQVQRIHVACVLHVIDDQISGAGAFFSIPESLLQLESSGSRRLALPARAM
jgi:hypothetical protein